MRKEIYAKELKKQLLNEFQNNNRNGIYAFTQKTMAYNSNRIEGSTLTSEQTALLFDTRAIYSESEFVYRAKDVEEMNGHFRMFNEVLKNLNNPLSSDMIKSFHFQLKTGVFEDYANGYPVGEYKRRANTVGNIVTALPKDVPQQIEELIQWYSDIDIKTLMHIAMFHAKFEQIHPFQDGNGRTGRAIILKQCLDNNLIPVIIRDDDKAIYYHALNEAVAQKDATALTRFFEKQQELYYKETIDFMDNDIEFHLEKGDFGIEI